MKDKAAKYSIFQMSFRVAGFLSVSTCAMSYQLEKIEVPPGIRNPPLNLVNTFYFAIPKDMAEYSRLYELFQKLTIEVGYKLQQIWIFFFKFFDIITITTFTVTNSYFKENSKD